MKKIFFYLIIFLSIFSLNIKAEEEVIEKEKWTEKIYKKYHEIMNSNIYDIFIPVNTWHNRAMYDTEKTREYNEKPYGIGIGKTQLTENNNLHQLYILGFADSHNKPELTIAYTFLKRFAFDQKQDFNFGIGLTAGFTFRTDFSTPLILPVASLSYKGLAIETTYIPGTYNSLNVLFTWVRLSIKF